MLAFNRARGSFNRVAAFIALSEFSRTLFIKGGLPADRVLVKRNFLAPDPGVRTVASSDFVYVGRLSQEKGIETLLTAWGMVHGTAQLKVVGDGPLRRTVEDAARTTSRISYEGPLSRSQVLNVIGTARALIVPSIWYESSPLTVIESFARGVPVIATRIGALQEMVQSERNGLLFSAGDSRDLAATITRMQDLGQAADEMGRTARADYESLYTGDRNYRRLIEIYRIASGT
jgi:glycosyltransferase involved in cell wall biosynthesis